MGGPRERLREGTFCNQTRVQTKNVSFVCWRPCEQIYLNIKKKTRIVRNTLATNLIMDTSAEWREVRCGRELGMEVGACGEREDSEVKHVCLQAYLGADVR